MKEAKTLVLKRENNFKLNINAAILPNSGGVTLTQESDIIVLTKEQIETLIKAYNEVHNEY